ncbi:MAG: hypothetical protein AAFW00_21180 [Bacteroidota bacterium]
MSTQKVLESNQNEPPSFTDAKVQIQEPSPKTQNPAEEKAPSRFDEMQEAQQIARDYIPSVRAGRHLLYKRLFAEDENFFAKPSTRFYFIKKVFQVLVPDTRMKAQHFELANKVGAVGEYCISIMYLDNHLQDQKYGVKDEPSRAANRKERALTEQDMYHYILREFDDQTQTSVIRAVQKLFKFYQIGMALDKEMLTYENLMQDVPNQCRISEEVDAFVDVESFIRVFEQVAKHKLSDIAQLHYLRLYLTRAFLINTVFFQIFAELLVEIFGASAPLRQRLVTYARMFGMAQQLVNDNCDYLPVSYQFTTLCKLPEDTYSDLRRNLVTLPIIFFFQDSDAHQGEIFSLYNDASYRKDITQAEDQHRLLIELIQSGALGKGMSFVCALAEYGEKLVQDEAGMFQDMFSFTRYNRYYKEYNQIKNQIIC